MTMTPECEREWAQYLRLQCIAPDSHDPWRKLAFDYAWDAAWNAALKWREDPRDQVSVADAMPCSCQRCRVTLELRELDRALDLALDRAAKGMP